MEDKRPAGETGKGGLLETLTGPVLSARMEQGQNLTAEEKLAILEKADKNLDPATREVMEKIRREREELRTIHQQSIDKLTQLALTGVTAAQEGEISPLAQVAEDIKRAKELAENLVGKAVMEIRSANEALKVDPLTGLILTRYELDRYGQAMDKFNQTGAGMAEVQIWFADMTNFKLGNHLKTEPGFDLWLAEYAGWLKQVSVLTGSRVYDSDIKNIQQTNPPDEWFGRVKNSDAERDRVNSLATQAKKSKELAGMGELITEMQSEGIIFTPGRDKPGGDEMFFKFEYTKGYSRERQALAARFLKETLGTGKFERHTTLGGDFARELPEIVQRLTEFPNALKVNTDNPEYLELNGFADSMRSYIMRQQRWGTGILNGISRDPNCQIPMGAAEIPFSYAEALDLYMHGKLPWSEESRPALFKLNEEGVYVEDAIQTEIARDALTVRLQIYLGEAANRPDADLAQMGRDILGRDVLGQMMGEAKARMEEAKKQHKMQMIIDAYSGDAAVAYQVGALLKVGRLTDDLNEKDREYILRELKKRMEPLIKAAG